MNKQQGRKLLRQWIKEQHLEVVDDVMLDTYVTSGLEATNDLLGYHITTDGTGVTLLNGTQDYTLPVKCVELKWVEWNGRFLHETDQDELRNDGRNWRQIPAGNPERYFVVGRTLSFIPKPNANAVATAPNPVLYYVSTPADFALSGFAQLASAHHRLPLLWGAAEFLTAVNNDPVGAKGFLELFNARVAAAKGVYDRKMLRKD